MADWANYVHGLHRVSDRIHVFLQPDGSWGLNNTALFCAGGESLLVDTLCDICRTERMLQGMAAANPAARQIQTVVLTHWHVDHVLGITAPSLRNSRIVASQTCADYLADLPPKAWLGKIAELQGDAKRQMDKLIGDKFDFSGIHYREPTDVFEKQLDLTVGGQPVRIIETKPSHTLSDSVVFFPNEGVVHVGDLVSAGRHHGLQYPFMGNLVETCEMLLSWDARTYVPGHGPVLDANDLRGILEYLRFLQGSVRRHYDAGLDAEQAADQLLRNLGPYKSLKNPAGLFFTVKMLYREFAGDTKDYVRRNYPHYLARQWQINETVPGRYPELFGQD